MTYVLDTSGFVTLFRNYYRSRFPSLWRKFDALIDEGRIVSTREVKREIEDQDDDLTRWTEKVPHLFSSPSRDVAEFVIRIYSVTHFQGNIERKKLLKGGLNADPFVVATAAAQVPVGTVVTLERRKPNAVRIPNLCEHFQLPCMNLEEFMEQEGWVF